MPKPADRISASVHTVTPRLVVQNAVDAIAFYRTVFGAEEPEKPFVGPDGKVVHAEIRIGDGVAGEVIGTPPFMAPEAFRQLELDPRTDLFSLGAVAYVALTGRHAYGARSLSELPDLWERPLPSPSAFVHDIPAELDRLVLSLLSPDALVRPQSAAAVMDQLTSIGELPAEPHERVEDSYILSTQMVGREKDGCPRQRRRPSALR